MTQTATQTAQAIATVTLKSNNLTYTLFPVKDYAVWTINGKPTHCTCKARKFAPHKLCKHMQAWLSENSQAVEAPVCSELKKEFSSLEEEFEYKLGAYGKKVAYGWLYEQKYAQAQESKPVATYRDEQGQVHQVTALNGNLVDTTNEAEQVAAVAEVQAEAKMDAFLKSMDEQYASDPRHGLSQGEMEAARSNMVHYDDRY